MFWLIMNIIKGLIVNIVVNWALLYFFSWMNWRSDTVIGIVIKFCEEISNSIPKVILAFLILWFVFRVFNSPIKWILKTLSCPVNFMTFWLVSLIINVLVFYMFQYVVNTYSNWQINVELWAIWQTLILSFIMTICAWILTKILK